MKRRINARGDINIPAELRKQLGWRENDAIEMSVLLNKLILIKAIPGCIVCRTAVELVRMGDYYICRSCIESLHNAKDGDVLPP